MGEVLRLEKNFGDVGKNLQSSLDAIEDENSQLTMEERFDGLMQQMIAFGFYIIDRHKQRGERIYEHEREWQKDTIDQLKMIERIFVMAKKNGRIFPKPNEHFDEQLIDAIKKTKSTVGEIVRKLPKKEKEQDGGNQENK